MTDITTPAPTSTVEAPLPPNFIGLLDVVLGRPAIDPELRRRVQDVRDLLSTEDAGAGPFMTVLLRTQGKRVEPLKDSLLCLAAQTDQDFEVLVLEHNAEPSDAAAVKEIIARQPEEFRKRIRLIEVQGGTRSRPLNFGIEAAQGRYIAAYDDDDLVFANWIEEFKKASLTADGRLLRALVANQSAGPEEWPLGEQGFRTTSWPKAEYAQNFDQLKHLLVNHSPFMTWAFPASLFTRFGVRFDEELTVCEDWDVILRGSLTCGVTQIDELTSIYRRWQGVESSYTKHSLESWRKSEARVIKKIDDAVIMLPPGSMHQIRDLVLYNEALIRYRFLFNGHELRRPVHLMWRAMAPSVGLMIRVRNKVRRMRARKP